MATANSLKNQLAKKFSKKQIIQDRYAIKLNLLTRKKISVNVKDIRNREKCKTFNKIKGLRGFLCKTYASLM